VAFIQGDSVYLNAGANETGLAIGNTICIDGFNYKIINYTPGGIVGVFPAPEGNYAEAWNPTILDGKLVELRGPTQDTTNSPWFYRVHRQPTPALLDIGPTDSAYRKYRRDRLCDTAVAAFGSDTGKALLHEGQTYFFGVHAGNLGMFEDVTTPARIRISVYRKSDFDSGNQDISPIAQEDLALPYRGDAAGWGDFVEGGMLWNHTTSIQVPGNPTTSKSVLETSVRYFKEQFNYRLVNGQLQTEGNPLDTWGVANAIPMIVGHRSLDPEFRIKVEFMGAFRNFANSPNTVPLANANELASFDLNIPPALNPRFCI